MAGNEMIGHDPLAWIKEEPAETASAEQPVQEASSVETLAVEEEIAVEAVAVAEETPAIEEVVEEIVEQTSTVAIEENETVSPVAASTADHSVIDLGEQLVISNVGTTRAEWMDRIVAGVESPITLEGGAVQMIDTAGLQLVVSLIRELGEDGVSWQWGGRSEQLQNSASQLGLTQMMSL